MYTRLRMGLATKASTILVIILCASCAADRFSRQFYTRVSKATSDVAPQVARLFGEEREFEVLIDTDESYQLLAGVDKERRVILFGWRAASLSEEALRSLAAHELAHIYMWGFWGESLDLEVQEGIAEWVASRVIPEVQTYAFPDGESSYCVGGKNKKAYDLINKIGFDRVRELALQAYENKERLTLQRLEELHNASATSMAEY